MRTPATDAVLAAHLLACPPCRDVDARLGAVPVPRETVVPARVWEGILGAVHRGRRPVRRRRPALRRPPR